jgi:hypothetical protein
MERLTILLILLFVILFIGQAYTREYFVTTVDISNSTLTMSLTDLLYAIGSERTAPDSVAPVPPAPHEHSSDVEQYLLMKQELINGVKLGLQSSIPNLTKKTSSLGQNSMTDSSASCMQGAAYMESVPLCSSS